MVKATAIDHICIAVKDLARARQDWESRLGLEPCLEYVMESEKIRVARYYLGAVALELMEGLDPDSDVSRFVANRGEGVYLIAYRVDDVEKALSEYRAKGERTIDGKPRQFGGYRYAFIHPPLEFNGVLTEILDGEFKPNG